MSDSEYTKGMAPPDGIPRLTVDVIQKLPRYSFGIENGVRLHGAGDEGWVRIDDVLALLASSEGAQLVGCSNPDFSGNKCRNCGEGNDYHIAGADKQID